MVNVVNVVVTQVVDVLEVLMIRECGCGGLMNVMVDVVMLQAVDAVLLHVLDVVDTPARLSASVRERLCGVMKGNGIKKYIFSLQEYNFAAVYRLAAEFLCIAFVS